MQEVISIIIVIGIFILLGYLIYRKFKKRKMQNEVLKQAYQDAKEKKKNAKK